LGVKAEKISEMGIRFKLKDPYAPFLERLTFKIIPKHIWQEIGPEKFLLSTYNLNPIGSGPYQFKELTQDKSGFIKSFDLKINPDYYSELPKISEISFRFFENEEDLMRAASLGEINSFTLSSPENYSQNYPELNNYSILLPRYFAVFLNQEKAESLDQKEIRLALNYGTNKEEILNKVLKERGEIVNSPILPELYGFESPSIIYQFDPEKAEELLTSARFLKNDKGERTKIIKKTSSFQFKSRLKIGSTGKEVEELQKCLAGMGSEIYPEGTISGYFGNKTKTAVIRFQEKYKSEILDPWGFAAGTGIVGETTREKLNEICFPSQEEIIPLSFKLTTTEDPVLKKVAENLKEQWGKLGIKLEIIIVDISTLKKETIPERNYQILLFGEALGAIPDPLPFWHSSQKEDPGLNLAQYENKKADALLEKARTSLDFENLGLNLQEFQEILIGDPPCILLYNPENLYFVSKEIKGVEVKMVTDLSKRFSGVENWYLKTERVWK
jgi:ABC-type transport system substrate-binding protein